jgi:hypothetical protein
MAGILSVGDQNRGGERRRLWEAAASAACIQVKGLAMPQAEQKLAVG